MRAAYHVKRFIDGSKASTVALRDASGSRVAEASRRLDALLMRAIDEFEKILVSGSDREQRLTADSILSHAVRLRELVELTDCIKLRVGDKEMSDWLSKMVQERDFVRSLYRRVASALLAPDGALVRWIASRDAAYNGEVSRAPSGRYVININDGLPWDTTYQVFLHECAHALDTSHRILRTHYYRLPPAAKMVSGDEREAQRADATRKILEERADIIASKLSDYANSRAYSHLRFDEPVLLARLRALAEPRARIWIKNFIANG